MSCTHCTPPPPVTSGSWKDAARPSSDLMNTSRRFALGASYVCLVSDNPTCPVTALQECDGLWSERLRPCTVSLVRPLPPPLTPGVGHSRELLGYHHSMKKQVRLILRWLPPPNQLFPLTSVSWLLDMREVAIVSRSPYVSCLRWEGYRRTTRAKSRNRKKWHMSRELETCCWCISGAWPF